MVLWGLLEGVIPFLIFVLIRHFKKNTKLAIFWAGVVGITNFAVTWGYSGSPNYLSLGELVFILIFGWLSTLRDNPLFFKLQPLAMAAVIVLGGTYMHFWGGGIINAMHAQIMLFAPEQYHSMLNNDEFLKFYEFIVTLALLVAVPLHGALITVAAYRWSEPAWLVTRAVGFYPIALVVMVLGSIGYKNLG